MQPSTTSGDDRRALVVIDDVFFLARLRDQLERLRFRCSTARDPAALDSALGGAPPEVVIVDLNLKSSEATEMIRLAKAGAASAMILAFAGHLATDRMEEARLAGAHRVVTNGQIASRLPGLLAELGLAVVSGAAGTSGPPGASGPPGTSGHPGAPADGS